MTNASLQKSGSIAYILERIGRLCGYLLLVLITLQFAIVMGRYVFAVNYLWLQELALYVHASIFMLAAPWALLKNRHVRIDVISEYLTGKSNNIIEIVGHGLLLFPLMAIILYFSLPYIAQSWSILEGSAEVSGLPGLFLLKSLIALFALLMLLAGLYRIVIALRQVRR